MSKRKSAPFSFLFQQTMEWKGARVWAENLSHSVTLLSSPLHLHLDDN